MMNQSMELRSCPARIQARRRAATLNTLIEALATMGTLVLFVALAVLVLCVL